ncbi:unnamed protein product [Spirodela intermedia]|uniref:Uncharacterized protein n=1 Tax=Spirodela intermedia TaxID=51605 RepID=A0A7I8IID2_SPIIN|nr:unnamed protein product [Spirodela intermedia]CAA6657564.1 unnamed protein product [Spirodela intermedia]
MHPLQRFTKSTMTKTTQVPLPPIEHIQAHGHVVEVDLPANPIHLPSPREIPQNRSEAKRSIGEGRRDSAEAPLSIMGTRSDPRPN